MTGRSIKDDACLPGFIFVRSKKIIICFYKNRFEFFSVCYVNVFIEKAGAKGGSPIKTNEAHSISPPGLSRGVGKVDFILFSQD